MTMLPFPIVVPNKSLIYEYVDLVQDTSDLTTYTFSNRNIGQPSLDRLVIVLISSKGGAARTLSSVSINGSGATLHVNPAGDWHATGIASQIVTSGTTTNISVTFSGGVLKCAIWVWTLKNYKSATPFATGGVNAGAATNSNVSFNVPANGIALYCTHADNNTTCTWSNAVDYYNQIVEGTRMSAAWLPTTAAISPNSVTATYGTSSGRSMAGASWA